MNTDVNIKGVIDTSVVGEKTIREVERIYSSIQKEITNRGGIKNVYSVVSKSIGIPQNVAIAAMYVWMNIGHFRYTDNATSLTINKFNEIAERTRTNFIQQHVLNYSAFFVCRDMYDLLCDKKNISYKGEGFWRKVNGVFSEYQKLHKSGVTSNSAWMTFQDHMSLSYDSISEYIEQLEVSIRDYLIQTRSKFVSLGQKDDITLLSKVGVCMTMLTCMQHSFLSYFKDVIMLYGIDFSSEFRYAELSKMARNFMWMVEAQGVKICKDDEGDIVMLGVNLDSSSRVNYAFNNLSNAIKESVETDDIAVRAINLNPEQKAIFDAELRRQEDEYKRKLAIQEKEDMAIGIEKLKEKYCSSI